MSVTFDELMVEVKKAYTDLSDCTALDDLEGFSILLYGLAQDAEGMAESEGTPDSEVDRLSDLADNLRTAAGAVSDMADQYTEAHMALTNAVEG